MGDVIRVNWNQGCPAISQDTWEVFDSEYTSATFDNGVCTQTYLKSGRGYSIGLRQKDGTLSPCVIGDVIYCSYEIYPESDSTWSAEVGGHIANYPPITAIANTWTRISVQDKAIGTGNYRSLVADRRSASASAGTIVKMRNAMCINLTKMFGAGKEPNLEEFEAQCALNGINLTQYQPYDSGTERDWELPPIKLSILARKKQIIAAAPHLCTAQNSNSSVVAHFKTDIVVPIKSLKVNFKAKQEGSGTPSPDNVRTIVGVDNIKVESSDDSVGKIYAFSTYYKLDEQGVYDRMLAWKVDTYGTSIDSLEYKDGDTLTITQALVGNASSRNSATNGFFSIGVTNLIPGENYIFTADVTVLENLNGWDQLQIVPNGYTVRRYEATITNGKIQIPFTYGKSPSVPEEDMLDFRVCAKSIQLSNIKIVKASGQPNYSISTIQLPSTFYGGYVDLITGELVQTMYGLWINKDTVQMQMDKIDTTKQYIQMWFLHHLAGIPTARRYTGISNRFKCLSNATGEKNSFIEFGTNTYFMVPLEQVQTQDLDGLKKWFDDNPTFLVYELDTPQTYQLSPQTIRTLRGANNIWSDQGDVEIKYWGH